MTQVRRPVHKHFLVRFKYQRSGNVITRLQICTVIFNHLICICTIKNTLLYQLIRIKRTRGRFLADHLVHHWLSCSWLIRFVMTTTTVTEHVDDYVFTESMTEVMCELSNKQYSFRIITIYMEDRRLNHFRDVSTVFCRTRITWVRRGKTNLVVHDNMNSTTYGVTTRL